MDLIISIQMIFLCAVNICFTFIGIVLNSLVIISFWKSSQLRKKLCYLMIIVLSWVDVLAIVANHPPLVMFSIIILTEHSEHLLPTIIIYGRISSMFFAFSLITLFVMSLERYLSTAFPIFHRKSVKQTSNFAWNIICRRSSLANNFVERKSIFLRGKSYYISCDFLSSIFVC